MAIDAKLGMTLPGGVSAAEASNWLDVQGLGRLRADAEVDGGQDPRTLRAVAQQFESVFLGMMLKSMRDANPVDSPFESDQTRFYQDLFDKQLSVSMAEGRGLGIADMLVRQLSRQQPGRADGLGALAPGDRARSSGGVPEFPTAAAPSRAAAMIELALARATLSIGSAPEVEPAGGTGFDAIGGAPELPPAAFAALTAPDAPARGGPFADSPVDFVRKVLPHARRAAAALGVSPLGVLAQAALETGWGRNVPSSPDGSGWNLFGIKAGGNWQGGRYVRETLEYDGLVPERRREAFRAYDSLGAGFDDYVALLGNSPRYAQAVANGTDAASFARGLQDAGYATDPDYARKLTAIAHGETLRDALATLKNEGGLPIP